MSKKKTVINSTIKRYVFIGTLYNDGIVIRTEARVYKYKLQLNSFNPNYPRKYENNVFILSDWIKRLSLFQNT